MAGSPQTSPVEAWKILVFTRLASPSMFVLGAAEEVIDTAHVMAVGEQALAEVRAENAGATDDQNPFSQGIVHRLMPYFVDDGRYDLDRAPSKTENK